MVCESQKETILSCFCSYLDEYTLEFPTIGRFVYEIAGVSFPIFRVKSQNTSNRWNLPCMECFSLNAAYQDAAFNLACYQLETGPFSPKNIVSLASKYITVRYCDRCVHPADPMKSRWIIWLPNLATTYQIVRDFFIHA